MKPLIVLTAVLIIILTFPIQYALENKNHNRETQIDKYVKTAKEKAKQDGCFTQENINELKDNILRVCDDITEAEIIIDVDTTPKYRVNEFNDNELIKYKIRVPVKKIIAANKLYGINDADNSYMYFSEGTITSELIKP